MTRTLTLTAFTMACFAANSLLCRAALGTDSIDPATFTAIRLLTGAVALSLLARMLERQTGSARNGSWRSAAALFGYALFFSLAYVTLDAATGALLLFACVQITMIAGALARGERPIHVQWLGIALAFGGLVYLLLPGVTAPEPAGAGMMAIAGVAWGVYSLRGRDMQFPVSATLGNFVRATPMGIAAWAIWAALGEGVTADARGLLLAAVSGAITSGAGYALWYTALRGLSTTAASVVQLSVPALAAAGGVLLLGESATSRLMIAGGLILGGIAATLRTKGQAKR